LMCSPVYLLQQPQTPLRTRSRSSTRLGETHQRNTSMR